jgi:Ankyrin repeats (3 copies)
VSVALLLVVSSKPSHCEQPNAEHTVKVTVSELAMHPREYDGQLVCVNAVAVYGWEGDNFLIDPSKPAPLEIPSRQDPASVWFYSKQVYSMLTHQPQKAADAIEGRKSDCHDFEGYFHFLDKPQMMGVFYPGSLQLECLGSCSSSDPQPHSLAEATHLADVDETRRMLQSNVDLRDKYRDLLLFLAAQTGRDDFAQELLAAGADPRFTSPGWGTSLMVAAWRDDTKIARLLLDHGAPVNATNNNGQTALMMAIHSCWDGKTGLTPEAAEAAKNNPDIQGRRTTFENCRDGRMVQLLLDAGADPNIKTAKGYTALLGAAIEGNAAAAEALLKAGADPSSKSDGNSTPESESCDRGEAGKSRVCTLLREALKSREVKDR